MSNPIDEAGGGPWVPDPPAWWQREVIYQIYPRSFFDTSRDGIGDLAGIREQADYLAWLGVGAVWLSPIYPSPDADLGYDISDYLSVDPRFGTLEDFDAMLATLHERDIRVILDLVPNHTSDQHPWFVESRSGPETAKYPWYVWRDSRPDGSPPNNWESYFGGPAWDYVEPPGQWYLHSFDQGQPDLNWENPEVREAVMDVMRFWLERGVDGFRVDVLWLLSKDPELRDNPVNPEWEEGGSPWLRLLRANSEDGPRAHEFARLLREVIDEYPDRVMVGEVVLPPARAVAFYGQRLDEAHMPHNFALTQLQTWSAEELRSVVEEYERLLPPRGWPNWLLGDHDFPRISSRVGPDRTRLAHMLLLTLRGTPTWYYGDELGLANAHFPPGRLTMIDPQASTSPERDRLTARTPMQWSVGPHAGFSEAEPWLPVASDDASLTVERQREDADSMLSFVRALIHLRRRTPALATGTYRSLPGPPSVFSFERRHPDGTVRVHLNLGATSQDVELEPASRILLTTHGSPATHAAGSAMTLRPYQGVIVRTVAPETPG